MADTANVHAESARNSGAGNIARPLKVQLHVHSERSLDSHWPVQELRRHYDQLGFDAIFLTDHDRTARSQELSFERRPLLLPGSELSLSMPFWPLGPHLVLLGVEHIPLDLHWAAHRSSWPAWPWGRTKLHDLFAWIARHQPGVLPVLAHLHWPGNLGTGGWYPYLDALIDAWQQLPPGLPLLVELLNPHSPTDQDRRLWHTLLAAASPQHPVWGVGSDDAHHSDEAGQAWVELWPGVGGQDASHPAHPSRPAPAAETVYQALAHGHFVATSGPPLRVAVEPFPLPAGRELLAETVPGIHLRLVGRGGQLVAESDGPHMRWPLPRGIGQGVVQVEAYSPAARTVPGTFWPNVAFSQPIWT
ncbi:MAG: hypothetical protein IMX01_09225 [Limnochordaceae bacterium]|nr:hypothetical protein [Limnochordaceae bacterium]